MASNKSIVETTKLVKAFNVLDINGQTLNEDYVSLKNYEHVDVVIHVGNVAGNVTVTLKQATAVAGTGEKALAFDYVYENGTKTTVSSDTFDILAASDDGNTFIIPIDASELDVANGFDCLRIDLTDPSAAALVSCYYHLNSARFAGDALPDPTVD